MKKPRSIQLNIAKPCHEDWQKMSPNDQGRFCGQCEKTVIDFTNWSDTALYNFFADYKGSVCGRFRSSQLQKELRIPYQPKSRLYRIAIACGLTLVFAQVPEAYSKVKHPTEMFATYEDGGEKRDANKDKGSVRGRVIDEHGNPIASAVVRLTMGGIKKMEAISDFDGNYTFADVTPGKYEIIARSAKFKATVINIKVVKEVETISNISITLGLPAEPMIMGGLSAPDVIMKGDVAPVEERR